MNPGQESTNNSFLKDLRDSVSELNDSTKSNSKIMLRLNIILVILSVVTVFPVIFNLFKICHV